jgi:hypothetical protein
VYAQAFLAGMLVLVTVVFVCCSPRTAHGARRTPLAYFEATSLLPLVFLIPGFA